MNIIKRLSSLLVVILSLSHANLHSELLVVKKTENGFAPLDYSNMDKDISEILLKYQWPMVITSNLSESEQNELLTSGKPNAEEIFIEKKLREKKGNNNLSVVFIPTALSELFVFLQTIKTKNEINPLQEVVKPILNLYSTDVDKWMSTFMIDLTEIIDSRDTSKLKYQKIDAVYLKHNNNFFLTTFAYEGFQITAHAFINQLFTSRLFAKYPELMQGDDPQMLSDIIKIKSNEIASDLISEILSSNLIDLQPNLCPLKEIGSKLANEKQNNVIAKDIALEYEARKLNKAVLFRGTAFLKLQVGGIGEDKTKKLLAGSTMKHDDWDEPIEQLYKKKEIRAYSISFGNSLFAGVFIDCGACAYNFLNGENKTAGYALLIDKKDQIQHNSSNLFFIAPLSSLASLFEGGEFFHSRTKAAILAKPKEGPIIISGLAAEIKDPSGVILITRDPLKHAALFSQFLAENGRIIQKGNEKELSPEEKRFVEDVKSAQIDAAKFYKTIQFLTPKVQNIIDKLKNKKNTYQPDRLPL